MKSKSFIEGGFGKNKKAMLVKDFADFHERKVWKVNRAINNNKDKFRNNVDYIDLKTTTSDVGVLKTLKNNNILTQAQIGNAKNIYIVSERGYAILIKIFDDDLSLG